MKIERPRGTSGYESGVRMTNDYSANVDGKHPVTDVTLESVASNCSPVPS